MALSWRVSIDSVSYLSRTEYRFGDITKTLFHKAKNFIDGEARSDGSEILGDISVELQSGGVCKRTGAVEVSGEATIRIGESLLLPAPLAGDHLMLRVWRVNVGLLPDALVGEVAITDPFEDMGMSISRGGKDGTGTVHLSITPVETCFVPVVSDRTDAEPANPIQQQVNAFQQQFMGLRNKLGTQIGDDFQALARRPLLNRSEDSPCIGECIIVIESIKGLQPAIKEPFFVIGLDGHEFRAERLNHACEADLTYSFAFSSIQNNLYIYCYDDLKADRNKPVGCILLPLSTLLVDPGQVPPRSIFLNAGTCLKRSCMARFMPTKDYMERFRPAVQGQRNTGMVKPQDFEAFVSFRVSANFTKNSPLRVYLSSVLNRSAVQTSGRSKADSAIEDPKAEPSLLSVLGSVDLDRVARNANRFEMLCQSPSQGVLRWLRGGRERGLIAGLSWFGLCISGGFPPPGWAWPLYIWLAVGLNGYLVAMQRQSDWKDTSSQPYLIWDADVVPETLTEMVDNFKKTVTDLDRNLERIVSFWERVLNMFSFADGAATTVCLVLSFLGASTLSLAWLLWEFLSSYLAASSVSWACAIIGFVGCMVASGSAPPKKDDDAFEDIARFSKAFECVPDAQELAHRYIATQVQLR